MKRILAFAILTFLSRAAFAVVMIEPYLGYETGNVKIVNTSGTDQSGKTTGVIFGARAGFKSFRGTWIAADFTADSAGKFKPESGASSDWAHSSLGVTIGFDSMFGLRLYGGYGFQDQLKKTDDSGTTVTFKSGTSFHAGLGYKMHVLPIAINIEYWQGTYKKIQKDSDTTNLSNDYQKFNPSGVNFLISVPMDFL